MDRGYSFGNQQFYVNDIVFYYWNVYIKDEIISCFWKFILVNKLNFVYECDVNMLIFWILKFGLVVCSQDILLINSQRS